MATKTKTKWPTRCRNCRGPLAHPVSIEKGLDGACEDKLRKSALGLADQLEEALTVMRAIYNGEKPEVGLLDCIDFSRAMLHAAGRKVA